MWQFTKSLGCIETIIRRCSVRRKPKPERFTSVRKNLRPVGTLLTGCWRPSWRCLPGCHGPAVHAFVEIGVEQSAHLHHRTESESETGEVDQASEESAGATVPRCAGILAADRRKFGLDNAWPRCFSWWGRRAYRHNVGCPAVRTRIGLPLHVGG